MLILKNKIRFDINDLDIKIAIKVKQNNAKR